MTRLRSMGIESVAYILLYLAETASALPKKVSSSLLKVIHFALFIGPAGLMKVARLSFTAAMAVR